MSGESHTDKPAITVVLPTYNRAQYLESSLRSITEQTFVDWELIVVDDASTDGTTQLLQDWQRRDHRITVIRNSQNKRLPASLNTGFQAARGAHFTWTSDDNMYRPHAFARMHKELVDNPDVDLVYSGFTTIDEHSNVLWHNKPLPPEAIGYQSVVKVCFLYTRRVHQSLSGYREDVVFAEDYDFWLRAYCKFLFKPIDEDLYLYRLHGGSMSSKRQQVLQAREQALRDNLETLALRNRTVAAAAAMRLARFRMYAEDRSAAVRLVKIALGFDSKVVARHIRTLSHIFLGMRLTRLTGFKDTAVESLDQYSVPSDPDTRNWAVP